MANRKDIHRTFGNTWIGFRDENSTVTMTNLKTEQTTTTEIPAARKAEFKQYVADTDARISYSAMLDRVIAFLEGKTGTPEFITSAIASRLPVRTDDNHAVVPTKVEASTGRIFCQMDTGLTALYAASELFPIGKEYADAIAWLRGTPEAQAERAAGDLADAIIRDEARRARILG